MRVFLRQLAPALVAVVAFTVLIVILMVKPAGLFGNVRERVV